MIPCLAIPCSQVMAKVEAVCHSLSETPRAERVALAKEVDSLSENWQDVKAATTRLLGKRAKLS